MTDWIANIQFAKPWFLWLLLALPPLWVFLRNRRIPVLIARTLILTALVGALADPQIVGSHTDSSREERIFAFDVSRSISAGMRQWMISATDAEPAPGNGDRTYLFGAEARESDDWRTLVRGASAQPEVRPENTSLQKLFEALLALPAAPRSLFLFTDGWETQGNLEPLLPAIANAGLKVYPIVPAARMSLPNVAVIRLMAPSHGDTGEAIQIRVAVENHNDRDVEGTMTLTRDGQPIKSETVRLKPGSQILSYQTTLSEGSLTSYRASFSAQGELDRFQPDNQALAWVSVRSKGKVLLISGRPEGGKYLEEILRRQGFEVSARSAASAPPPAGFNVIIFNNVERERLSLSYLNSVEKHVHAGNSFVMLGSEWSFGPGGYRQTPIETILPVEFKEAKQEERNRAVVLVIDKSGSMREDNRILYAQEAAKAVARQLKDNDLIGVTAFDVEPFVVVPLAHVGGLRGTFNAQVDRLKPGGRTILLPAIQEAKRQLERQKADRKHLIILSDGETGGSGGEFIDLVNVMRAEQRITVSSVAIGAEANVPLMKRISQYGGGFFHHTFDPTSLPQIVLQQVQEKVKDEPPPERDLRPVQERGSELLAGFSGRVYPPLRGFIETELKRGAQLDLMIPRQDRKAPLLASWRYGRGKTVALTTDLEGRWSKSWIGWSGLPGFWESILEWLQPVGDTPVPLHEVRISLSGTRPVIDLYLFEEASLDSQFRFTASSKAGENGGAFKQIAPGHHQAALPMLAPGEYRVDITEERKNRPIAYPPVGFTSSYNPRSELPRPDINLPLLAKLAESSGGEINPTSVQIIENSTVTDTYHPLWGLLAAFAAILFLLEVAARKLLLGESS